MKIVEAGIFYFAIALGTGFVLGAVRIFWLGPHIGSRAAELLEEPLMLVVIIPQRSGSTGALLR